MLTNVSLVHTAKWVSTFALFSKCVPKQKITVLHYKINKFYQRKSCVFFCKVVKIKGTQLKSKQVGSLIMRNNSGQKYVF